MPWLDAFQAQYPGIRLRMQLSDRIANMYRDPVDLAIRYGTPSHSSMVALPLVTDNRRVLCASPAYLEQYGNLSSPHDLVQRNCLCLMIGEVLYNQWQFTQAGQTITVNVNGNRTADDSDAIRRWALQGEGICYRSRLDVAEDIAAGRLKVLCEEWIGETVPLYMMCPDRRQLSPMIRMLREYLEAKFHAQRALSM
jgi:DNA-binding transcriptional LysR family regulator